MHRCPHTFKKILQIWVVCVGSNSFQGISLACKPQVVSGYSFKSMIQACVFVQVSVFVTDNKKTLSYLSFFCKLRFRNVMFYNAGTWFWLRETARLINSTIIKKYVQLAQTIKIVLNTHTHTHTYTNSPTHAKREREWER